MPSSDAPIPGSDSGSAALVVTDGAVIVIKDYNMFRDIEGLMIRLMIYKSDIVLNGATETLYLMCNCVNISN